MLATILAWLSSLLAKLLPELLVTLGDKEKINVIKKTDYVKTGVLKSTILDDGELLKQLRDSRSKLG